MDFPFVTPGLDANQLIPLAEADLVNTSVTNAATYTVPANKCLVIHGLKGNAFTNLRFDGVTAVTNNSANDPVIVDAKRTYWTGSNVYFVANDERWDSAIAASTTVTATIKEVPYLYVVASGVVISASGAQTWYIHGELVDAGG